MSRRVLAASAAVFLGAGVLHSAEMQGSSAPLGSGTVASYTLLADDGAPAEIGVIFSAGALDGLPAERNRTSRCFDMNGNGAVDDAECEGDYQTVLDFADEGSARDDIPFRFAMVNYNPHGHPPMPWSVPHFDIHFYSVPLEEVEAIRIGGCDFFIDCEDRKKALMPVPAKYVAPDHADVGAAVGQMGNHLIDTKTPELAEGGPPFTHTWIFGAYDGRITFHEVMATTAFLSETGSSCTDIKQPQAWQVAGYYPTRYCFRRDEADGSVRVFMSDFVLREPG